MTARRGNIALIGARIPSRGARNNSEPLQSGHASAAGQWARLEVPASNVGLEGASVTGMAFTLYGGRVTFDNSGKSSATNNSQPNSTGDTGNTGGTNTDYQRHECPEQCLRVVR